MTAGHGTSERLYRALLRLYPATFRTRFADEMVQLFSDQLRDARSGRRLAGTTRIWLRTLGDLAVGAVSERVRRGRSLAHALGAPPSVASRLLGFGGVVAGVVLLWPAFLPALVPFDMTPDLFNIRLVFFTAGAIAIVIGVHRREAPVGRWLAWLAAVPAVLANAWYLALIVHLVGQPGQPGAGDYGPAFFPAAVALWLTDAWFGVVALRLGVVTRVGALALAFGSALTITGIAQFGLTSGEHPTIFDSLALLGIALNGLGWIALGLDVATRRRTVGPRAVEL